MKNKVFILVFTLLVIFSSWCFIRNIQFKDQLKNWEKTKQQEFKVKIEKERELIKKDLEEKYRADMVSYEAMAKRLELEKQKVKELEAKIKDRD